MPWIQTSTQLINLNKVSCIHLDRNRVMFFMQSAVSTATETITFDNHTKAHDCFTDIGRHLHIIPISNEMNLSNE